MVRHLFCRLLFFCHTWADPLYVPYIRFPTDVKTFLENVTPLDSSGSPINASASDTPTTFALLSTFSDPSATYLSSIQDTTTLPDPSWLNNQDGKPDETKNGTSSAPVEIIVAPKDGGIVDVFYFFFFAYNEGPE